MSDEKHVVMFGLHRSLSLLLIFVIAFLGMTFVFVHSVLSDIYPVAMVAMFGAIDGLFLLAAIFGINRYFTEKTVMLITANYYALEAIYKDEDEDEEDG